VQPFGLAARIERARSWSGFMSGSLWSWLRGPARPAALAGRLAPVPGAPRRLSGSEPALLAGRQAVVFKRKASALMNAGRMV
jgi:hypothetical protein